MMKQKVLACLIICISLLVVSCSDENPVTSSPVPPELPPLSSMTMDLSLFQSSGLPAKTDAEPDSSHFQKAITEAGFILLMVEMKLMLPRLILKLAKGTEPEFKNGKWVWKYSFDTTLGSYSIRLVAKKQDNGKIHWAFYTSSTFFSNSESVLYFEGTTTKDGTRGTWRYYDLSLIQGESSKPNSKIEWVIKGKNDIKLILTFLADPILIDASKGDTVKYTFDGTVKMLTIHHVKTDTTIIIAWNVDTKAGYIMAPNYKNGNKACWDSDLQNVACSQNNL